MGTNFSRNKVGVVIGVAASVVGAGIWIYYKLHKNEKGPDQSQQKDVLFPEKCANLTNIQEQIEKLKLQIDIRNPTLQDVKQIVTIIARHVRKNTVEASNKFKDQRRKRFPKGTRMEKMSEYFKFTSEGLVKLQRRIMELQGEQSELMTQVGISQAHLDQHSNKLGQYIQDLFFRNDIPLEDLKRSINIKIDYLQKNGQKIVEQLVKLSSQLSLQDKQQIPLFVTIIISDQSFENHPQFDKDEFDIAYEKFRSVITPQLIRLQKVLMPLMGRLQSTFIGQEIGGNEMLGNGNCSEMTGDMGGMSEQMMMQQLYQLRQSDPQAYEQLKLMMQAQMGK